MINPIAVITTSSGVVDYQENDAAVTIDGQATLTDADSSDFGGGKFIASISVGATANDRLAIRNEGSGAGQIGVSGANVAFSGVTIGSFTGGEGSTALQVTLDSDATPVATEALLRNITYVNLSEDPSTSDRTVQFFRRSCCSCIMSGAERVPACNHPDQRSKPPAHRCLDRR